MSKNGLSDFRRFGRLLRRHHRPLISAFFVLAIIRGVLTFRSYRHVLKLIERTAHRQRTNRSVPVIVWSIKHASRLVPGASCLTQALAVRYFLIGSGEDCIIRIGIKPSEVKTLDAHAWVIYKGRPLIGGNDEELRDFKTLVDL